MLLHGDCLLKLKELPDNSVDSIVTDPPYGLSFMGKKWDYDVPTTEVWKECLRVLKPGGHLLAFFGTRTYHRGVVRIEDAGFEIRDQIMWIYGSGFPKSTNVALRIDKENGSIKSRGGVKMKMGHGDSGITKPSTGLEAFPTYESISEPAKQWQGWGTALKPANEPIVVARKPLEKGLTIAENVMKWGTGALNIDASRIATGPEGLTKGGPRAGRLKYGCGWESGEIQNLPRLEEHPQGRWPANVLFDEEAASVLNEQSGVLKSGELKGYLAKESLNTAMSGKNYAREFTKSTKSEGGASRFFYVAKASKRERNAGLEGMPLVKQGVGDERPSGQSMQRLDGREARESQNHHPTVKPIKLMEYLINLVTPPNGRVLDPFMGSGSTGVAARNLNREFIGIELSPEYFEIAKKRIGV